MLIDEAYSRYQRDQAAANARKSNDAGIGASTVSKTYKAPKTPTPKKTTYVAPKATYKAPATTNYQTVAVPAPAPAAQSMDDLIKKYYDQAQGDVNSIYDKQMQSQFATLKAQRDAAIGKINQQKDATKQEYYDKRNQADVVNAQNLQRLREIMAANGVSTSGENLTLNAQSNSDRQNALNSLNQQEQAKNNDYASQIADWNNPARDQAITNSIESARAQALLNAKQNAFTKAWNEYGFNNLSAQQLASLGLNKYQIDAANASNSASNQALLDYYNSAGFKSGSGGGGNYQSDLQQALSRGLDPSWVGALNYIVGKESGYKSNAQNPTSTAYGYGQFLNSTRSNYEKKMGMSYSNPVNQLLMTVQYMKDRYGSPQAAINFKNSHGWY